MDIFKIGLRNIIGVVVPGTLVVLTLCYGLFSIEVSLNQDPLRFFDTSGEFLLFTVLFLLSYFIGSMIRLVAADHVDERAARHLTRQMLRRQRAAWYRRPGRACRLRRLLRLKVEKRKGIKPFHRAVNLKLVPVGLLVHIVVRRHFSPGCIGRRMERFLRGIMNGRTPVDVFRSSEKGCYPEGFIDWLWRNETFPYPVYQFRVFQTYYPDEILAFFKKYELNMGIGSKARGKIFFNYCKMVILDGYRQVASSVVEEVGFAEAIVRFNAGTYYGLLISSVILSLSLLVQVTVSMYKYFVAPSPTFDDSCLAGSLSALPANEVVNLIATVILIVLFKRMRRLIVSNFRRLRLKEVDTVNTAFYLASQPGRISASSS